MGRRMSAGEAHELGGINSAQTAHSSVHLRIGSPLSEVTRPYAKEAPMYPHNSSEKFPKRSSCTLSNRGLPVCTQANIDGVAAAKIGRRLVEMECRGRGDLDGAFHRLAVRTGIGHRHWRDWWHWQSTAQPERVLARTWNALVIAYHLECTRLARAIIQELEEAKRLTPSA
jgi:hypothetical protein